MEAKLNYHPFLKYKVTIPEDFPVTTISGVLYITTSERLILTARTREGKSLLSLYAACKVKEDNPDTIVLIISPNLTANVDDYVGKMNYFEAIKATGVDLKTYKRNKKELTFEFAGIPIQNNIYVVNCDYRYIDELVELCSHSSKQIFMVVDEAHKGGEKTYHRVLKEIATLPHVSVLETTATFRSRVLTRPHGKVDMLLSKSNYISPIDATPIPIDPLTNWDCIQNEKLAEEHLDRIAYRLSKEDGCVLINGANKTSFHTNGARQVEETLKNLDDADKVAIVLITNSQASWRPIGGLIDNVITVKGTKTKIKDASSVIKYVYDEGYRKIVILGNKMVEMGQTIGFAGFDMLLQIHHTSKSQRKNSQNADNIAQLMRTGGIGIKASQEVMIVESKWNDYVKYINSNEDLRNALHELTPEEQQEAIRDKWLELDTLRVNNGDYDAKQVINTENLEVITQYDEIELEDWMQDLLHYDPNSVNRSRTELSDHVKKYILNKYYDGKLQKFSVRTCRGDINTKMVGSGNEIQRYLHADPTKKDGSLRNLVIWMRPEDKKLAMRWRDDQQPKEGLIHDYWGKPGFFSKKSPLISVELHPIRN